MNNPIPLEYLTSFSQTSQAMMQQLATGLTHAPGQHRVSRDRACARPLRHGAHRLNQIWRLEEQNHD